MEYRQLGRSGLKVSLHSLGTMNFAGTGMFEKVGSIATPEAARLVDVALEHGVNLIDTSNVYSTGRSEAALGEVLKGRSNQILVGTKVRFTMGPGPNEVGLSRFHIIERFPHLRGAAHSIRRVFGICSRRGRSLCNILYGRQECSKAYFYRQ